MSTVSANATTLPDRRRFLSTVAGIGALGVPVLPALGAAPGPIEAMWPDFLRLEAALDDASIRASDAEELYEEPERPRWHPVLEEGGYVTIMTSPGRGHSVLDFGDENIAYLKNCIAREYEPDDPDAGCPNKLRGRRARKTLAKIEEWHAEVRRRKDAAALTEAEAEEARVGAAAGAHRTAMLAIEATTFRELAFQAVLFDDDWRQAEAERVLERLTELAGVMPRGMIVNAA